MHLRQQEVQRAFELLQTYQASPLAESLRLASLTVQPSGISVWRFEQYPFDIRLGEEGVALQLGRLAAGLAVYHPTASRSTSRRSLVPQENHHHT